MSYTLEAALERLVEALTTLVKKYIQQMADRGY